MLLHHFPPPTNTNMHLNQLRDGQWQLIQLALRCLAESDRVGTDLLSTHLLGSKADLSVKKNSRSM